MTKNPIKVVIFDFDGVLVDSVAIKQDAFEEIFTRLAGDLTPELQKYLRANNGVSRRDKFTYLFKTHLKKNLSEGEFLKLSDEFLNLIDHKLCHLPVSTEVQTALQFLHDSKIPMYVASGAPHQELLNLCKNKNISRYFIEMYGSPTPKEQVIEKAIRRHLVKASDCLMIGDSRRDYDAAHSTGTQFLGILSNFDQFPEGTWVEETLLPILKLPFVASSSID